MLRLSAGAADRTQDRAHTKKDLDHYFKADAHNYHTETVDTHSKWLRAAPVGQAILDVGSGSGLLLQQMLTREAVLRVLAIDISRAALKKGREIITDPRVKFEHRSIYTPFRALAGAFDTAYMRFAIHHFEFAQLALDNTAGALRPGGHLIVHDVLGYDDPAIDLLFAKITRLRQPADFKFYGKAELRTMCGRAGFRVKDFMVKRFTLNLERWLSEYEEPKKVLSLFERAPAAAKQAFGYREVGGTRAVSFRTYMLVAERV
jgi:SAM-dependent methyltransferase